MRDVLETRRERRLGAGIPMQPTIAVLITYHNEGRLLTECLDSLLTQADRPKEILVYDDASDVPAEEQVPDGADVRVIRSTRNTGPARGRNALLRAAESEFLHFH